MTPSPITTMSASELLTLARTDVRKPIPSDTMQAVLTRPPFVYVPGTFNTRDLGKIPTATGKPCELRPGFVYRTGFLDRLTDDGKALLAGKLGIKKIFDLRSIEEHGARPDPEIPGVEGVWSSSTEKDAGVDATLFIEGHGEKGYVKMYFDVLRLYERPFKAVLEHVRDHPDEPFMFHCTAGRDRTGVLAGLLLTLAGADHDTLVLDWMLSRIGTEPARAQLLAFAQAESKVESLDDPGFLNLANLTEANWNAFEAELDKEYGGFSDWATKVLGFPSEELEIIKKNLTASDP